MVYNFLTQAQPEQIAYFPIRLIIERLFVNGNLYIVGDRLLQLIIGITKDDNL